MKKIVVAAGGTGGHLFPSIATGEELINRGYEVHLITDLRCQKYLTKDLKLIPHIVNLKNYHNSTFAKIRFYITLLTATFQSIKLLYLIKPSAIIGFGGYPSFPPLLASVFLRIPIIIHEQNCFMGKVNKFFLKFAKKIALSYRETKNRSTIDAKKILITGNIIRANIKNMKIRDNFSNDIFRIFIFGGSQGAKIFSSLIPESIKLLVQLYPEVKLHITEQVSKEDHAKIDNIYSELKIPHQLSEFFHDMPRQYANQELVIARAGASTISELTYIGLPAIFIPLPSAADNHQFYNAKVLEDSGAGWCFEQNKLSAIKLAEKILLLIKNREILKQTSRNLLKRKSDGSKILADEVEKL